MDCMCNASNLCLKPAGTSFGSGNAEGVTLFCQADAAPAHRASSWTTNRPAGQPTKSQLFIQAASHPARELDEFGHSKSLLSIWRAICQLANSTRQAGKPDAKSIMHPTRPPPCLPATHPANHSADQPSCHQARAQSWPFVLLLILLLLRDLFDFIAWICLS